MNRIKELIKNKKYFKILLITLPILIPMCLFFYIPPVYKFKSPPITIQLMNYNKKFELGPSSKNWTPLNQISLYMIYAIVASEDDRFYLHNGIDINEIKKSAILNYQKGKWIRGASTITQQLVKNTLLTRHRTINRKIREIFGALLLEKLLSKNEILNWYLNVISFGSDQKGIKSAANFYFNVKPEQLTLNQSIHLAIIIPSPTKGAHNIMQKKLSDLEHRRFFALLKKLKDKNQITEIQFQNSLDTGDFGNPIILP